MLRSQYTTEPCQRKLISGFNHHIRTMQSIQEEPEDVGKALSDSIESVLDKCKVLQETAAGYSRRLKAEGDALGSKVRRKLQMDVCLPAFLVPSLMF